MEFNRLSLEEQHKKRIVAAVKANWSVAFKNLVDNLLESIKTMILQQIERWLTETLLNDDEIREFASEDPRLASKRNAVKDRLRKMRECKNILR